MNDLEISKALSLAIGWKVHQILIENNSLLICVKVATLTNNAYWRRFDYRDPAVIWPIAERHNSFPLKSKLKERGWFSRSSKSPLSGSYMRHGDTAAKAVALAIIWAAS